MHLAALWAVRSARFVAAFFVLAKRTVFERIGKPQMSQSSIWIRHIALGGILTVMAGLFVGSASAGQINSIPAPAASGPGLGFVSVPAIVTITPNNDDVPGTQPDTNLVVPLKRFDSTGFIDIPFTVTATQGVTEYLFTEFVDNNTGFSWNS